MLSLQANAARVGSPRVGVRVRRSRPRAGPSTATSSPIAVELSPLSATAVSLEITASPNLRASMRAGLLEELTNTLKLPGFRKGATPPESMILGAIGEGEFQRRLVEALVSATLPEALARDSLADIVEGSEKVTTEGDELLKQADASGAFTYSVSVDVVPPLTWSGEYTGIRVSATAVTDSMLDAAVAADLDKARREAGVMRIKRDTKRGIINDAAFSTTDSTTEVVGPLALGDVAIVDFQAYRAGTFPNDSDKGEIVPSVSGKSYNCDTADASSLLPGFVDGLLGHSSKEEPFDFPLTFPDDWADEAMAGQAVVITARLVEVFEREDVSLNDALAERHGYASLSAWQEQLRAVKQVELDAETEAAVSAQLLEELAALVAETPLPESLVVEHGRERYSGRLLEISATERRGIAPEEMAKLSSPKLVDTYIASQRDDIEREVRTALAVAAVHRAERDITATAFRSAVSDEVVAASADFEKRGIEFDNDALRNQAIELTQAKEVLEYLRENAFVVYE